ncbi:MAG: hypothetical protein ACXACH_05455 [Candidatus Hermodarchaeia archaeon]|jgi:hypothetical protein
MTRPAYREKGRALDRCIEWEITVPRFRLTSTQKRKGTIQVRFKVHNNKAEGLIVRIQLASLSKFVRFSSKRIKVLGKNRIHEETSTYASVQKQTLTSKNTYNFQFTANILPHFVFQSQTSIVLEYEVSAFDLNGKIVTHSEPIKIVIPFSRKR